MDVASMHFRHVHNSYFIVWSDVDSTIVHVDLVHIIFVQGNFHKAYFVSHKSGNFRVYEASDLYSLCTKIIGYQLTFQKLRQRKLSSS